ncbi:hypothetical protein AO1008_04793 [Aspergillus oryzae 100-8]|uniref:Uncharacterized protein n=1 Tax=Aspergillus oryzae (strain 3.042) TaxID=1160506 RepID=I8TIT8_ASPO3|nr:hypothetical protein Ao3042_10368 [Aspergillus oryzae 3.042]KDE78597.1 hypothetical protein AO1008_04793 [Aspergillus oryzae 100-8]|eukprot:EIT73653.1 hypothetical protein Ao3042_10368 [Aspergillus oryzae 3.042]
MQAIHLLCLSSPRRPQHPHRTGSWYQKSGRNPHIADLGAVVAVGQASAEVGMNIGGVCSTLQSSRHTYLLNLHAMLLLQAGIPADHVSG